MSTNSESVAELLTVIHDAENETTIASESGYWTHRGDPLYPGILTHRLEDWLAEHDRAVAAAAWEEGRKAKRQEQWHPRVPNPYAANALVVRPQD